MSGIAETIRALDGLLQTCISAFGAEPTFLMFMAIWFAGFLFRVYEKWQDRLDKKALIREKEATIERISLEALRYRRIVFDKVHGWDKDELDRYFG